MPKLTAEIRRVVWIKIEGESAEFTRWLLENKIFPAGRMMMGGAPGLLYGAYWPHDADRIVRWLEEHGVEVVEVVDE